MKQAIHPKYFQAKVSCACGNTFTVGSTVPEIKVDICNQCHPFFTGKQKYIDTAGRIDRFKARLKQTELKKVSPKSPEITDKELPAEKADADSPEA